MDWELIAEEKYHHKSWKVRREGYEDILRLFQEQNDEEEFLKYAGLMKRFVVDSNSIAQETGLATILYFVENAVCAPSTVKGVMSGLVSKCFSSSRAKTRELVVKIALKYVELGEKDAVSEELMKGLINKSPKVVLTSLVAVQEVVHAFGPKVISIKSLMKVLRRLLEDRYERIREESKRLCGEIYRWIGDDFIILLQSIRPVILTELMCDFRNRAKELPVPTRCAIPRQKYKINPYYLMDAVDVLSRLTNDFYKKCCAKKWRDRKEALEMLFQLTGKVKLQSGDYCKLVMTLRKLIAEDCNISVVTLAIKCLRNLVLGLRTKLQPYAFECIPTIFGKFREKNQKVVVALREAIDSIYFITSFDVMMAVIQSALDNKNPQVKAETCYFLTRCLRTCSAAQLNMRLLIGFTECLLNNLSDANALVREYSAEALGTALKIAGKRTTSPFLSKIAAIKMAKVKYYFDEAVVTKTVTIRKKSSPLPKHLPSNQAGLAIGGVKNKPNYAVIKETDSRCNVKQKLADVRGTEVFTNVFKFVKEILTGDEIGQISEFISTEVIEGVSSTDRKDRLCSVEKFSKTVRQLEKGFIPANSCIQILARNPGFKDSDFGILKLRFETLIYIAKNAKISRAAVDSCLFDITNQIGDAEAGVYAASALSVLSEADSFEYISAEVLQTVFILGNPKIQSAALMWLSNAIKQFGLQIQVEQVEEVIDHAFYSDDAEVRAAVLALFGTMHIYVGKFLCTFFKKEKPVLQQFNFRSE